MHKALILAALIATPAHAQTRTAEFLSMDWPAAVVFVALIIGAVVIYGIRRAAKTEEKRIEKPPLPALKRLGTDYND